MRNPLITIFIFLLSIGVLCSQTRSATAQDDSVSGNQTLEELKAAGAKRSSYRKQVARTRTTEVPKANLKAFLSHTIRLPRRYKIGSKI